jgi:hypothetical protein
MIPLQKTDTIRIDVDNWCRFPPIVHYGYDKSRRTRKEKTPKQTQTKNPPTKKSPQKTQAKKDSTPQAQTLLDRPRRRVNIPSYTP